MTVGLPPLPPADASKVEGGCGGGRGEGERVGQKGADWTEFQEKPETVVAPGADKATADRKKQQQVRGPHCKSGLGSEARARNGWGDATSQGWLGGHSIHIQLNFYIC